MISRYRIVRGARAAADPPPEGVRQDTRKHTRHVLRPDAAAVQAFLADPSARGFAEFRREYLALLERRFAEDPQPFAALVELAQQHDVFLGCNCPTERQPDVGRCHTVLALEFLAGRYPELELGWPPTSTRSHSPRAPHRTHRR